MEPNVSQGSYNATDAGEAPIAIHVNGEPRQSRAATLAELIEEAGHTGARVATALNGEFVPARARATTSLKSGDHVEIVAPRQGG